MDVMHVFDIGAMYLNKSYLINNFSKWLNSFFYCIFNFTTQKMSGGATKYFFKYIYLPTIYSKWIF